MKCFVKLDGIAAIYVEVLLFLYSSEMIFCFFVVVCVRSDRREEGRDRCNPRVRDGEGDRW